MKNIIDIKNNYYLEMKSDDNNLLKNVIDIKDLNLFYILNKKEILVKINFKDIDKKEYKKILKNLLFIISILKKKKIWNTEKFKNVVRISNKFYWR